MNEKPDISVVMSVYNGAKYFHRTIISILNQKYVNLELIVVDDGSTDETGLILDTFKNKDQRVKIISQNNRGLTHALIKGCEHAQGKYIARHDAGDISAKDRLIKQFEKIKQNPGATFVSCGTRFQTPNDEYLYEVISVPQTANSCLLTLDLKNLKGPSHHGSTLFSKEMYKRVGGYRTAFYFAQDLDLWIRLAEHGRHIVIPEILYNATVTAQSISGQYRKEQIKLARYAIKCAQLRRKGLDESDVLEKAGHIQKPFLRRRTRLDQARALYFIGSCLKNNCNLKAKKYFQQAFLSFPFHFKSGIQWLISK
ncbi:glycosyltransferase [Desulfococcaceae bacterium HSG7]|nr:glycosyltransferase [Desulfococcaceae bacterium HSG7]